MTSGATRRLRVRRELIGVEPYGAPQIDVPVRLDVNENPYPPSVAVASDMAAAVREAALSLHRYPDREATALRTDLADYVGHGLNAERIWAANGSNEVMMQLLQAFGGPERSVLTFTPSYSMYPQYARDTHTRYVEVSRESDFTIDPDVAVRTIARERPAVIVVASPNNPTGTALSLELLRRLCDVAPGVVVVDEAYAEFRRAGTPSALSLLDDYPQLAVSRTMSKAFALAGGRLGYLASSIELVDSLRVVRLPYHLSTVTQAVARVALAHKDAMLARVDELRDERDATAEWLRRQGLDVAESDANFVLFGMFADRRQVWQGLVDRGVLIRETGPDGWLRVSIGTSHEMMEFKRALTMVLEKETG
ncbi:MAG: histidinol-phosphate transaminase [Propionibacteriales bacterium]|nr:histidinol-phosphate transaminase [Propionibacteriales bacterium]